MNKYLFSFLLIASPFIKSVSQVYHNLAGGSFSQNWSNLNLITANDNWTNVPGIIGYLGDDPSSSTVPINPQTALLPLYSQTIDVIANQNNPNTATSGGVAEFELINPTIALQGSATADAPNIVLYINSSGISGIRIKYLLRDVDGSADNAVQPIALQYRIGSTGNFIDIPAAFVADASTGPSQATAETPVDIVLPAACDNQPELQLRIITGNASGSDEWIGIDEIEVSTTTADTTPPAISTLLPANGATNTVLPPVCTIIFTESVQKGTGNITIKQFSDGSIVQTIDVTSAAVTVVGSAVNFTPNAAASTRYYIEVDAGTFKDASNNQFVGFTGSSTWNFTTGSGSITSYIFNFNGCTTGGTNGSNFTQFSLTGDSLWKCTSFGFGGTSGSQISGFSTTQGALINEDWLISPALNLAGFANPLLKYKSRTRFKGLSLKLFVSTNYSGTGSPALASWTEINGRFPQLESDVWTTSDSINLLPYKSNNTYVAWVYYSNPTEGAARWTIDDVELYSSATLPAPALTISNGMPKLIPFGIHLSGSTSPSKSFKFWATEVNGTLEVSLPAGFEASKNNNTFAPIVQYSNAELNNEQTLYLRFKPSVVDAGYGGTISFTASNLNVARVDLAASSLPENKSLDVVNWNITWFGSPSNAPVNDDLQLQNARIVMDSLKADMYMLQEIVDTTRLGILTRSLQNGPYSYKVALFGSNAPDNTSGNWPSTQKTAYIYKTEMFGNITTRAFTATSTNPNNFTNWSSGRYPLLLEADVTVDGITKRVSFINIHAKAELGIASDYQRRKGAADLMADSLNINFPTNHFIVAGDFNDDLDVTISSTAGTTTTPYISFMNDPARYSPVSFWNSARDDFSYIGFTNVIDHAVVSNEMNQDYHAYSSILRSDAIGWVNSYRDSLTNHIPLITRFNFRQSAINNITSVPRIVQNQSIIRFAGNPGSDIRLLFEKRMTGPIAVQIMNLNGQAVWQEVWPTAAAGQQKIISIGHLTAGVYVIQLQNKQLRFSNRFVR
jgi:endonuclease/exonuclease/phosphatase family metal-dependent hydrolase